MTEVYSITANLVLNDGTLLDISSHIREIRITQSKKYKHIYYDLLISNQFLKYINSDLNHIYFTIKYKSYSSVDQKVYTLSAKPTTYPLPIYYQEFNQESPYKDYVWIHLFDYNIYNVLSKKIDAKVYNNTNILDIVKQNCDIEIENDPINDKIYEQIFIPTMTFENLLDYLNYWYGFFEHSSHISIVLNPYDVSLKLRFIDLHYRISKGKFDVIIYKHSEKDSIGDISKMETDNENVIVTSSPINFKNNLPNLVTFKYITVIEKPDNYLYKIHKEDIESFLNNNTLVDKYVDLQEDSVTAISDTNISIRNHTETVPVYSMYASEFNSGKECTIVLENKDVFNIWPGHIINLQFSTPDLANHQGLYHVDVVRYSFKFKDAYWRNLTTLICERTNYLRR